MLPTTNSILLQSLLEEDRSKVDGSWAEMDTRYRPVLFAFARRLGLADEDARELAQDVLVTFVEEYRSGRYERERGRLRSWLFSIARARVAGVRREHARQAGARGVSVLAEVPAEDELPALWEAEWRRAILRASLDQLRSSSRQGEPTLRAFEAVVLEGRPPAAVGAELGLSTNSVYVAKFRTLERLRAILERMDEEW